MNIKKVTALYFSPCGSSKTVALHLGKALAKSFRADFGEVDLTRVRNRKLKYVFKEDGLILLASPIYAGRIPNKIYPDLKAALRGEGALAIPLCTYGNRSFGDGLSELKMLLSENGFKVIGGAAMVSRHVFSSSIGAGRPDEADLIELEKFGENIVDKIRGNVETMEEPFGNEPPGPYYTPLKEDGTPAKFLKAKPKTDMEKCISCTICAKVCPMGSIDFDNCEEVTGVCIKCMGCVHACIKNAKYFDDEEFLSHVKMLEANYTARNTNRFFGL